MKKQLLIAAVAATMTSAAFAELSITGNAKYEYFNIDASAAASYNGRSASATATSNSANTEVNIKMVGKSGDTTVELNQEFNTHGSTSTSDIEDMFITTKIGDVKVKAGHYATGTSGILGEIDNGSRATDKITLSTTLAGVKVYAGDAESTVTNEMSGTAFYGFVADVAGVTVQAKRVNTTTDAFAVAGDVAGVAVRYEMKKVDGTDNDVDFLNVTTSMNGFDLGYARISADADGKIKEDDSSIFALENGLKLDATNIAGGDSNQQITIATSIAGNTVTLRNGSIGYKAAGVKDTDYSQIDVKRNLASGTALTVSYSQLELGANSHGLTVDADVDVLELDLSVKF